MTEPLISFYCDVVTVALCRLKDRMERSCARLGVSYPWWIPAYSTLAAVVLNAVAYAQRGVLHPEPQVAVAALLALAQVLVWIISGWLMPPWLEAVTTAVAVVLYLTQPVSPDFAPLLFMVMAGEVGATMRPLLSLGISGVYSLVLIVAAETGHLQSAPLYVVGVVLGVDVGITLRWQMRALTAERANSVIAGAQAALAERQRLAREIHDIVGHSLSITLLHVTAARHALQRHADLDDAIVSLTDAETVGRAAMGELRRTVALIGSAAAGAQPLPGVADIPELIERSRLAGLDVRFEDSRTGAKISDVAGLGLYRIAQESLANIAKHAPAAAVTVCLTQGSAGTHLSVRNSLPAEPHGSGPTGTGLEGMRARAQQMGAQLRAGALGGQWVVELSVPTPPEKAAPTTPRTESASTP
jgi:signal transduction histidine kinase